MLKTISPKASISRDVLYERAERLVSGLRERAPSTERSRVISHETISALKDAELFRVLQPARFGGLELDLALIPRLVAEIARGCGSTGWVYGIFAVHEWLVAMFPIEAQEDVWGHRPQALISGTYAASARADSVVGGYRISGAWDFASGCDHADWHLVGALLPSLQDTDAPTPAFMLVPRSDLRLEDNWHTIALCGTGSKKVVIVDAFVPAHRVVTFKTLLSGNPPGAATHGNALYRVPYSSVVPTSIAPAVFGIVQDAIDEFIETRNVRASNGQADGEKRTATSPIVQSRLAEAAGYLDAAKLLVSQNVDAIISAATRGDPVTIEMRVRNRRNYSLAVRMCVQAIDALYACSGGTGIFLGNRTQRAWRNVHAAAKHVGLSWETIGPMYGQFALGLEPKGQF